MSRRTGRPPRHRRDGSGRGPAHQPARHTPAGTAAPADTAAPARPESHRAALLVYAAVILAGCVLIGLDRTLGLIAGALNIVFVAFFVRHLAFALAAARWAEADMEAAVIGAETYTPTVAVLVGCKDERLVIDSLVGSLLDLDYPADRSAIVIIDDGSSDGTGARLDEWAAAEPRLQVLHRPPGAGGGKSGALNQALRDVTAELTVIFDADHEPDQAVLRRLVRHFRDPQVGAVMGRCVVRNGNESSMASTVFVDYLSGYLVNEYGRQALFELPAYGGANCAVRTTTLRALGGWNHDTVTEDTDLTLRVLLYGDRIRYDPAAVDFEEAVVSARRFWRQRHRWARGHQKCLRDYWRPVLRSPYLNVAEKLETLMFLWVYHVPVLCGLGVLLSLLRAFGFGGSAAIGLIPLSALLFAGPFTELSAGLLLGRVERAAAWRLIGFIPAFALSIVITTHAYLDGMIGRPYTWAKTARSGRTDQTAVVGSDQEPATGRTGSGSGSGPGTAPAGGADTNTDGVTPARTAAASATPAGAAAMTGLVIRSGGRSARWIGLPPGTPVSFARRTPAPARSWEGWG